MDTTPSGTPYNFTDLILDAVCVVNRDGYFEFVSNASERIFGYRPEEMVGRSTMEFIHPDDQDRTCQAVAEIMAGIPKPHFENRYRRKDGSIAHIMWSARWSESDQVRVAVARDVSELRRAEAMQRALYAISEAANGVGGDLSALFTRIHNVVSELLPARNFVVALYDAERDELTFPYYADQYRRVAASESLQSHSLIAHVVRTGESVLLTEETAAAFRREVGIGPAQEYVNWLGVPLESDGETVGALVVHSCADDVSYCESDRELLQFIAVQVVAALDRHNMHERLQYMAQYDDLTGLPNRALVMDRLVAALAQSRRSGESVAVLYLDLDRFKEVNDTFGHAAGDCVLQQVAARLQHCLRSSDTVGRLGGDEFIVVLGAMDSTEAASAIADKIHAALNLPYSVAATSVALVPSIGIALFPEHGDNEHTLLRYADEAMYQVKRSRRTAGNRQVHRE